MGLRINTNTTAITALSYQDPAFLDQLLDRMAEVAAETLAVQIAAGAAAIQIFDTWAGLVDPDDLGHILDALLADRTAQHAPVRFA